MSAIRSSQQLGTTHHDRGSTIRPDRSDPEFGVETFLTSDPHSSPLTLLDAQSPFAVCCRIATPHSYPLLDRKEHA